MKTEWRRMLLLGVSLSGDKCYCGDKDGKRVALDGRVLAGCKSAGMLHIRKKIVLTTCISGQ